MNERRLVYSTEGGRLTLKPAPAAKPSKQGAAKPKPSVPDDGFVRLFRERGARGGKIVTVIRGLPERGAALEAKAQELKRFCGAGGTVREDAIEIQGDHRERLAEKLKALGYKVKIAGG